MKIQPLGDNILVELLAAEKKSPGGIVLPDVVRKESQRGKVVAVGKGKILENGVRREIPVKKGDVVLFMFSGRNEVVVEGKKYLIVDVSDISAVVKE